MVVARLTVVDVLARLPTEPVGVGVVPVVRGGSLRDEAVYERIVEVFRRVGGPLKCRDVCDELGMPEGKNATESMRSKLKRLVGDGVLTESEPGSGLFALVTGVDT